MSDSISSCIENKVHLALKPQQRDSSDADLSNIAHKVAFLIRRQYGPDITSNQVSVIFHDACAHKPPGSFQVKCVSIFIHKTAGRDGVDHFIHVRGMLEDDLVRDLGKEVDTMCF